MPVINRTVSPFVFRFQYERLYTMRMAQALADGKINFEAEQLSGLQRYARWHFSKDFLQLVQECREMEHV